MLLCHEPENAAGTTFAALVMGNRVSDGGGRDMR